MCVGGGGGGGDYNISHAVVSSYAEVLLFFVGVFVCFVLFFGS